MSFIKKEPIACIGLLVTLILGLLSSPVLMEWYSNPKVSAFVTYKHADDGRCVPQRLLISNSGKSSATNIRVQYSTDYFSTRGDIQGFYSGDVASLKVQRNVEYTQGKNFILIPNLLPGISQEFVFVEEPKVSGMLNTRLNLLSKKDPSVFNFPRIDIVTSNEGKIGLTVRSSNCD